MKGRRLAVLAGSIFGFLLAAIVSPQVSAVMLVRFGDGQGSGGGWECPGTDFKGAARGILMPGDEHWFHYSPRDAFHTGSILFTMQTTGAGFVNVLLWTLDNGSCTMELGASILPWDSTCAVNTCQGAWNVPVYPADYWISVEFQGGTLHDEAVAYVITATDVFGLHP